MARAREKKTFEGYAYGSPAKKIFAIRTLFFVASASARFINVVVLASQCSDDLQTSAPCHMHCERPSHILALGDSTSIITITFIKILLKIDFTNSSKCRSLPDF